MGRYDSKQESTLARIHPMTIVLADKSALFFWRWWSAVRPLYIRIAKTRTTELPKEPNPAKDVVAACEELNLPMPYEILVHDSSLYRKSEKIRYRSCSAIFPTGALYQINKGFYVIGPEFLFLRMAKYLNIVSLAIMGCELTGKYSIGSNPDMGFHSCVAPLTTVSKISRFLTRASGLDGIKKARRALRWVVEDTASPREAELACLLCLPQRLGGYALPVPISNYSLKASDEALALRNRASLTVDLAWPKKRLAIEYDSTQWHSGDEKFVEDSIRRNAIKQLGFEVITVTNKEFNSISAMDNIVEDIKGKLGVRSNYCPSDHYSKKTALRRLLNQIRLSGLNNESLKL